MAFSGASSPSAVTVGSPPARPRSAACPVVLKDVVLHNASRYAVGVIRSFRSTATERLWSRQRAKGLDPRIERTALRKLVMLDAAESLEDLRVPPGNRLEALKGDRAGQYSIRINQQWRICFAWTQGGPQDVEIVDYH